MSSPAVACSFSSRPAITADAVVLVLLPRPETPVVGAADGSDAQPPGIVLVLVILIVILCRAAEAEYE